jgi:parvulin-like peptidyl-prolyl isomerase
MEGTSGDEVQLRVIVVRSAEEAQRILQRLKKGEDFGRLAREHPSIQGGDGRLHGRLPVGRAAN